MAKSMANDPLGYSVVGELNNYIIKGHSEFLLRKSKGAWADFQKG
jgi:hypothetical protein